MDVISRDMTSREGVKIILGAAVWYILAAVLLIASFGGGIDYWTGIVFAGLLVVLGALHLASRKVRLALGRLSFVSSTDADDALDQLIEKRIQLQGESLAALRHRDPAVEVVWSNEKPRVIELRRKLEHEVKRELTGWIPVTIGRSTHGDIFGYVIAELDESGEWRGTALVGDHPDQHPRELY